MPFIDFPFQSLRLPEGPVLIKKVLVYELGLPQTCSRIAIFQYIDMFQYIFPSIALCD